MLTATVLLLVMSLLGAFDIAYFHTYRCRLSHRPESRTEAWIHVARGVVYTLQLALVPGVRFAGAWYAAFVALFVADVSIALVDVAIEPASRRSQGGLPAGEYFMHIVLSILAGAYLHSIAVASLPWASAPDGGRRRARRATAAPGRPRGSWPRAALLLGRGVRGVGAPPARPWPASAPRRRPPPAPRWRASGTSPRITLLHPTWDHRFSRIEMLAEQVVAGTEMR